MLWQCQPLGLISSLLTQRRLPLPQAGQRRQRETCTEPLITVSPAASRLISAALHAGVLIARRVAACTHDVPSPCLPFLGACMPACPPARLQWTVRRIVKTRRLRGTFPC